MKEFSWCRSSLCPLWCHLVGCGRCVWTSRVCLPGCCADKPTLSNRNWSWEWNGWRCSTTTGLSPTHPPTRLHIHPPPHTSTHPPTHPFIRPHIHPPAHTSIHPRPQHLWILIGQLEGFYSHIHTPQRRES